METIMGLDLAVAIPASCAALAAGPWLGHALARSLGGSARGPGLHGRHAVTAHAVTAHAVTSHAVTALPYHARAAFPLAGLLWFHAAALGFLVAVLVSQGRLPLGGELPGLAPLAALEAGLSFMAGFPGIAFRAGVAPRSLAAVAGLSAWASASVLTGLWLTLLAVRACSRRKIASLGDFFDRFGAGPARGSEPNRVGPHLTMTPGLPRATVWMLAPIPASGAAALLEGGSGLAAWCAVLAAASLPALFGELSGMRSTGRLAFRWLFPLAGAAFAAAAALGESGLVPAGSLPVLMPCLIATVAALRLVPPAAAGLSMQGAAAFPREGAKPRDAVLPSLGAAMVLLSACAALAAADGSGWAGLPGAVLLAGRFLGVSAFAASPARTWQALPRGRYS